MNADDNDEDHEERYDDVSRGVREDRTLMPAGNNNVPTVSSFPMMLTMSVSSFRLPSHLLNLDDISETDGDERDFDEDSGDYVDGLEIC